MLIILNFHMTNEKLLTAFHCISRKRPQPQLSVRQAGGKSTLCNLISRFWDVDGGNIRLGGIDVREYSMDSLMKNFSFVFQNVYLFADTIANNIAFGRENATREEIVTPQKRLAATILL